MLRRRGYRGGVIGTHRAFARLHPTWADGVIALTLVLGMTLLWVRLLPVIGELWGRMLRFGTLALGLPCTVTMMPQRWAPHVQFSLPFLTLSSGGITPAAWSITAGITMVIFAASQCVSDEHMVWIYFARTMVIIQGSALVYFAVAAARFPHDLPTYTMGMLSFGIILIGLVPAVLGLSYYVFDFSAFHKLALTVLIMGHLTLFVPLQYLLHAYVLHRSMLFMPLLYFACGPFLDVLVFVALYAWGMSWSSRATR